MKNKFQLFSLILFCFISFNFLCQKPVSDTLPGPGVDGPRLPATSFDYLNNNVPTYIKDFIAAHPECDNTPQNNTITNDGATLGRVLFYDKSLSINNKIACASCHHQDKAFTDGLATSVGFQDGHTRRNSMSTVNVRFFREGKMFWDMRANNLEAQTLMPITDPIEMGMHSLTEVENKLRSISYYPGLFKKAFGTEEINSDRISKALSQFLRSIVSFRSKYDEGLSNNFANFNAQEIRGKQLVMQFNCVECHSDLISVSGRKNPTFIILENSGFNTGNGSNNALDELYTDNGIGERTNVARDMGTFKMPSLRNVELTAPYMHDGRFTSLQQVIEHYNNGAKDHPNRGIQIPKGGYKIFTEADKNAIIEFLKTLTDKSLLTDPRFADPFK